MFFRLSTLINKYWKDATINKLSELEKFFRIYALYHWDHCLFSCRRARLSVSGRKIASWWGTSWRRTSWEARKQNWQPLSGFPDWTAQDHSSAIQTSRWPRYSSFLGSSHCVSRLSQTSTISTATVVTAADPC